MSRVKIKRRSLTTLREWRKIKKVKIQPSPSKEESTQNDDENEITNELELEPSTAAPLSSPTCVPTFSSPDISDDNDGVNEMKVTTHTTMEVKTIDALNAANVEVEVICSERDEMKLELGNIYKRGILYLFIL